LASALKVISELQFALMKVFRIRPDIDRYQTIDSVSGFVKKHPPTRPYAKLLKDWEPIELPVDDPTKPRGGFLYFPLEYLVCSRSVAKAFEECVREDVQALPVSLKGDDGSYELWNITNFVEAHGCAENKVYASAISFDPRSLGIRC